MWRGWGWSSGGGGIGGGGWGEALKTWVRYMSKKRAENLRKINPKVPYPEATSIAQSLFNLVKDRGPLTISSAWSGAQTGCCKPPGYCGYEFEEDTTWKVPEKGLSLQDSDCKASDNNKEKLCYNCDSCKAGYLALFVKGWKKITVLNYILLVISILIFMIAICAIC